MRRSIVGGLAIGVLLAPRATSAQAAAPALTGQVLDAATRVPVRAAVVELAKKRGRVLTDSVGRFTFPSMAAGTYVVMASALGYQDGVGSAQPGSPVVMLLVPSPVPLRALVALSRTSTRTLHGANYRVFGRDDLLAAGDIPVAQFVNWKAHFHHRLCRVPQVQTRVVLGILSGGSEPTGMAPPGDAAAGGFVTDCIVGAHGAVGPYAVMVDGHRLTDSGELWAHKAWDLARVEVVYQRVAVDAPFGVSFDKPFAFVRIYTLGYLARTAARVSHLCEHIASADTLGNPYLASLCGP